MALQFLLFSLLPNTHTYTHKHCKIQERVATFDCNTTISNNWKNTKEPFWLEGCYILWLQFCVAALSFSFLFLLFWCHKTNF